MARLVFKQKAIDDLSEIWEYTFLNWSEKQADIYYEAIKLACVELSENARIGSKYPEIGMQVLGYRINKHIIFYRELAMEKIEIIRILHERMDLKSHIEK